MEIFQWIATKLEEENEKREQIKKIVKEMEYICRQIMV